MKKILGFFIVLLLLLVAGVSFYLMADRTKPEVLLVPDVSAVSAKKEFTVTAKAESSGVKSLRVTVNQGQKDIVIVQKKFSPAPKSMTEKFTLESAGLRVDSLGHFTPASIPGRTFESIGMNTYVIATRAGAP